MYVVMYIQCTYTCKYKLHEENVVSQNIVYIVHVPSIVAHHCMPCSFPVSAF